MKKLLVIKHKGYRSHVIEAIIAIQFEPRIRNSMFGYDARQKERSGQER